MSNDTNTSINIQNTKDHTICSKLNVLNLQIYVNFHWVKNLISSTNICKNLKRIPVKMTIFSFFENIFDTVSLKYDYPPI